MRTNTTNLTLNYIITGILTSAALTVVIGLTATNLSGFRIVGNTDIPFAYPWRLAEPNAAD